MKNMKIKIFVNTDDKDDILTIEQLRQRYIEVNGGTDGFWDYITDGCRDGIYAEFKEFSIWTTYADSADMTFVMADCPWGETVVLNYFSGGIEMGDYSEPELKEVATMYGIKGIKERYADIMGKC